MAGADLQPGYILHLRNYTDTRVLVDLLTRDGGRITAVARKGPKRQTGQYLLFSPLLLSWRGAAELKTLMSCEPSNRAVVSLSGSLTYCGLYLNELLVKAMPPGDPNQVLFSAYETCLAGLAALKTLKEAEPLLRVFELTLLDASGLGLDYGCCCSTGEPIEPGARYELQLELGFSRTHMSSAPGLAVFQGEHLLAIGRRDFSSEQARVAAKQITRMSLTALLGSKTLKSRELLF